jgi:LysM repeat protein
MKQWKRLAFFLLINIFVSACTTMGVLFAWDRLRAPIPGGVIQPLTFSIPRSASPTPPPLAATDAPAATPAALFDTYTTKDGDTFDSIAQAFGVGVNELVSANGYSQPQVLSPGELLRIPIKPAVIDSVIGAGDLNTEHVVILNNLDGQLSLGGWQLEDNSGHMYTFPQLTLFSKGGSASLYTRSGTDNAAELYWGLPSPLWQSGMVVTLRDPQGTIQATFTVP